MMIKIENLKSSKMHIYFIDLNKKRNFLNAYVALAYFHFINRVEYIIGR